MPPKKRHRTQPKAHLGVARSYINTHFSTLPESLLLLKNGHVLYVYVCSDGSRSQTERVLRSQFSDGHLPSVLNSRVKSLVSRTLSKFKRLTNPKQFQLFDGICQETFNCGVPYSIEHTSVDDAADKHPFHRLSILPDYAMPHLITAKDGKTPTTDILPQVVSTEEVDNVEQTGGKTPALSYFASTSTLPDHMPMSTPSTSCVSIRSSRDILTPREQKLKKRLIYITNTKVKEARKFKTRIAELKLKTPKRVINQSIRRKNEQLKRKEEKITELKEMLAGDKLASELRVSRKEFSLLKLSHYQLKKYHKERRLIKCDGVPLRQHRIVKKKLEALIEDLQVQLEDERDKQNDLTCKKDGKTFNTNYRKCIYSCILNQVPVKATGQLIQDLVETMTGIKMNSCADCSTVNQCTYELGILADIQVAETIEILERQPGDSIAGVISSPTPKMMEVTKSALVHNITSEHILGLIDCQYRSAPNATIGFIDGKVKAKKNKTLEWLKSKPTEEQNRLIAFTISRARKYRAIMKERESQTISTDQKRPKEKNQEK